MKKILWMQFVILFGGTAYAWYQWVMEYLGKCDACGADEAEIFTKCFIGAAFFSIAFLLNVFALVKLSKK